MGRFLAKGMVWQQGLLEAIVAAAEQLFAYISQEHMPENLSCALYSIKCIHLKTVYIFRGCVTLC